MKEYTHECSIEVKPNDKYVETYKNILINDCAKNFGLKLLHETPTPLEISVQQTDKHIECKVSAIVGNISQANDLTNAVRQKALGIDLAEIASAIRLVMRVDGHKLGIVTAGALRSILRMVEQ